MLNIWFGIASVLLFFSVFPSMKELLRNKRNLKGFSLTGSVVTAMALIFVYIGYTTYGLYANILLSLPLLFYYIMIVYYCIRIKIVY